MKKLKILAIIPVLALVSISPLSTSAIGLVTEPIVIDDALRGGEFQETLNIVNTQNQDIIAVFGADGAITNWAKFYLPSNLKNPLGEIPIIALGKADIIVVFTVPGDTPNGTYQGFVSVTQKAKERAPQEGQSVSIAQKIDREVTIKVTDKEIVALEVSVIPEKYDLSKNEALRIRVIYDNQGNISLTPQIQLKIKNESQQVVYSAIFPYPETELSVNPSATYEIPVIEIPTSGLVDGKYFAELSFSQKAGGEEMTTKNFRFSVGVFELASLAGSILGAGSMINWYIFGGAGLLILLLIVIKLIVKKKNGKEISN